MTAEQFDLLTGLLLVIAACLCFVGGFRAGQHVA